MRLTNSEFDDKQVLFRQKENEFLERYFLPITSVSYPSLFICGLSSTGKTFVTSKFLQEHQMPHIWVNCYETPTSQLLLASIIEKISKLTDQPDLKAQQCSTVCDLINVLKQCLHDQEETVVFVFDNAEVLRNKLPSLLPVLLRLQELTESNICTVLISEIIWEKFQSISGLFEPLSLHFGNYSKEQLVDILCLDYSGDYSMDFYRGYVDIILKVFYVVTKNLNELRHVAKLNFAKYCEPIVRGEANESSSHRLFKNIEPVLREAIHAVYLREVSAPKWNLLLTKNANLSSLPSFGSSTKFHMTKELPFYSKFLLISCYFASYNLPKTDFKHFVKNQGKQKKKRAGKKTEKNRHLLGPKAFALDRMLSIFFSIVGHGVLPSAVIHSQVASLVNLQLIMKVSVDEQLDTPKYKCLAELDLVRSIGKTVNVDVTAYLDDFI